MLVASSRPLVPRSAWLELAHCHGKATMSWFGDLAGELGLASVAATLTATVSETLASVQGKELEQGILGGRAWCQPVLSLAVHVFLRIPAASCVCVRAYFSSSQAASCVCTACARTLVRLIRHVPYSMY